MATRDQTLTAAADPAVLLDAYPELDIHAGRLIVAAASRARICAETTLFQTGSPCRGVMWLLQGTVRVYQRSPDGREVTFYRVYPGELCLLTLYGLLHDADYAAEARAETDLNGLVIRPQDMLELMNRCESLRTYLMKDLTARLQALVTLVGDTALHRLELRLACLLGQLFERFGTTLSTTHEAIANELGTNREVISRLLKQFERQGCIRLGRGQIELTGAAGLDVLKGLP